MGMLCGTMHQVFSLVLSRGGGKGFMLSWNGGMGFRVQGFRV